MGDHTVLLNEQDAPVKWPSKYLCCCCHLRSEKLLFQVGISYRRDSRSDSWVLSPKLNHYIIPHPPPPTPKSSRNVKEEGKEKREKQRESVVEHCRLGKMWTVDSWTLSIYDYLQTIWTSRGPIDLPSQTKKVYGDPLLLEVLRRLTASSVEREIFFRDVATGKLPVLLSITRTKAIGSHLPTDMKVEEGLVGKRFSWSGKGQDEVMELMWSKYIHVGKCHN